MEQAIRASVLIGLVFGPMLVEARRSVSNERIQRERGGVEARGDVYSLMRVTYPAAFAAMIAESAIRDTAPWFWIGLIVFAAAKALKWWAIVSLGRAWTFRVIVVPGASLVSRGPYAWLSHPNYVAVVGELCGVALMAHAVVAGPIATVGFGALMWKRVTIEARALARVAAPR